MRIYAKKFAYSIKYDTISPIKADKMKRQRFVYRLETLSAVLAANVPPGAKFDEYMFDNRPKSVYN